MRRDHTVGVARVRSQAFGWEKHEPQNIEHATAECRRQEGFRETLFASSCSCVGRGPVACFARSRRRDAHARCGGRGRNAQQLDAPLLFVKRHSYTGIHIYDTFYKWPPGGGGIYVLENPSAPHEAWRIRPVIDPTTPETLGEGVYTHPELSWDATRLLFCFKGEPEGSTSIYEIGIDGTASAAVDRSHADLRRLQREPARPARHGAGLSAGRSDRVPVDSSQRPGALLQHRRGHPARDERRWFRHPSHLGQQRQRVRPVPVARRPDSVRPLGVRRQERLDDPVAVDDQSRRHAGDGVLRQQHGVPRGDPRRPAGARTRTGSSARLPSTMARPRLDRPGRPAAGQEQHRGHRQPGAPGSTRPTTSATPASRGRSPRTWSASAAARRAASET